MNPPPIPSHWTEDRERLSERLLAPPRLLVACDFDGTLAPIASTPDGATLPGATEAVLRQLAEADVRLAILSGRALDDVRQRVSVPVDCFAGNHGLEMAGHGLDGDRVPGTALEARFTSLTAELDHALREVPGVLVENKRLALAIHYRQVNPADWPMVTQAVGSLVATDPTLRMQSGHCVLEVLPDVAWDKGEALKQIAARLGIPRSAIVYLGDDTTDEHAFRAIPNGTTVSVGTSRPSAAQWMAHCPDDVRDMLAWVADLRQ
jgi:trehalose 6-phosphate phosphatase